MDAKTYLKISGLNLAFLVAGALIGPLVVNSAGVVAHAQETTKSAAKADTPKETAKPPAEDPNFEYVSPNMSGGVIAANIFVGNRVVCDRLVVNGYEPLKLNDGILAALQSKGVLNAMEVQRIVAAAKTEKPIRIRQ